MLKNRYQNARWQSIFYRDQYYRMIRWLFFCLFVIVLLLLIILYYLFTQPTKHYYANTSDGQILSMPNPSILRP